MKDLIHKNIKEVVQSYFRKSDLQEFNSFCEQLEYKTSPKEEAADTNNKRSLIFKTQVDLLITFASNRLAQEKFIALLLHLSKTAITIGEFSTSIEIAEKLSEITEGEKDYENILANALLTIGEIKSRQAEWETSFNHLRKVKELFLKKNDYSGAARCENIFGTIYGDMGDLKQAVESFEAALDLAQDKEDFMMQGKIEINLGIVNTILGKFDAALSYFRRSLLGFEKVGDFMRIAEIHQNISMVYLKKEDYDLAAKEVDEAISASRKINYLQELGISFITKALIGTKIFDFDLANAFADKAMEVAHKLSDKLTIAEVYRIKGIIQRNLKNYTLAENFLLTSLRLNKEAGNQLNLAETSNELGLLYRDMGRIKESEQRFKDALEYFRAIEAEPEIAEIEAVMKLLK